MNHDIIDEMTIRDLGRIADASGLLPSELIQQRELRRAPSGRED